MAETSAPGPALKLARAKQHIVELTLSIRAYAQSQPYGVEKRLDESSNAYLYTVRVVKPMPEEWALIVGDVVHNARAALDHLTVQLVEAAGRKITESTAFPFAKSQATFAATCESRLAGTPDSTRRFMSRMRPYPSGNTLLHLCHALDVIDKHRLILVLGGAYQQFVLPMSVPHPKGEGVLPMPSVAIRPADPLFPVRDGTVVFSAPVGALTGEPQFVFGVALGAPADPVTALVPQILNRMIAHIERILTIATRRLLPAPQQPN
jgi:hypothetical protein